MDSKDQLFELGKVVRIRGVKGEVEIFLDSDNPAQYKKLESLLLELKGELVPFFISGIRIHNRFAWVKFTGTDSVDDALLLVHAKAYLPLEQLPPLPQKQYYFHEIIGAKVIDKSAGLLGEISQIYDLSPQPLAEVKTSGKDILFPLLTVFIENFEKDTRTLFVDLPEGLIDIYSDEKK